MNQSTNQQKQDVPAALSVTSILDQYKERLKSFLTEDLHSLNETKEKPFLSVILRTQGKRYEMLKEALLCLDAQTDQSFEVILVLHNADEGGKEITDRLLDELCPSFRSKIRREFLEGGTRSAPLNYGAAMMQGKYFAMLDDDDVLFDNWVENFHRAADANLGKVIRCYGATQPWKTVTTNDGVILQSSGPMSNQYCKPFHLLNHLEDNYTPISCVAIPAFCFQQLDLRFDEALTTAEDWDYIMRCVLSVGVYDTEKTTFLYRLWMNNESSRSLHSHREWNKNRKYIIQKLNQLPIITDRQTLLREHKKLIAPLPSNVQQPTSPPNPVNDLQPFLMPYSFHATCRQIVKAIKDWLRFKFFLHSYIRLLDKSPYFDEHFYLKNNPDVRRSGIDPTRHYLLYGWRELRDPSADFSTRRYLERNPDVLAQGVCPLLHYEQSGKNEQRKF